MIQVQTMKIYFKKLKYDVSGFPSSSMVAGNGKDFKITEIRCNDVIGECEKTSCKCKS